MRVSNEALLGTIAACPKCGSMVQIQSPRQDVAAPQIKLGSAPVDSEAITEDGIAAEIDDHADASLVEPGSGFSSSPPPMEGPPPVWQDDANWQSDQTKRTRQIAMIATIALSTLSVTALTFGWFLRSQRTTASVSEPNTPERNTSEPTATEEPEQVQSEVDTAVETSDDSLAIESQMPDPVESELIPPPAASVETDSNAVNTVVDSTPPSTVVPSSLIPTSPIGSGEAESETESSMTELPAGLLQFVPLMLGEGLAEKTSLAAPPSIDQVNINAAAIEDSDTLGIDPA